MTLREMLERRAALSTEMQGILAKPAGDAGELSAEQETRFTALRSEADGLNGRIDRQAAADDLERRIAGTPISGTGDNRFDAEVRQFSLVRAIAAQLPGATVDAGREREISAELARRSGRAFEGIAVPLQVFEQRVITSGGSGGNVVATVLDAGMFINRLYAATRVRQLGATMLTGLVGNVDIPRLSGSTSTYWVADNVTVTASDATFDKVSLRPKTAGILSEYSRNMLLQSSPDIDTLLRNDMARTLAVALDSAAVAGPGTGNQPTGILSTSGIGSVALGTNGAALAYDNFVDLIGQVQDTNAEAGSLAFLTNYKVERAALKLKTTTGEPLGEDVVFQNRPRAFTTGVPSNLTKGSGTGLSAVIYGNWSDLLIGVWSELDVLVNPYGPNYAAGNVQVRAMMTVDIEVRHPQSFAAIVDAIA